MIIMTNRTVVGRRPRGKKKKTDDNDECRKSSANVKTETSSVRVLESASTDDTMGKAKLIDEIFVDFSPRALVAMCLPPN